MTELYEELIKIKPTHQSLLLDHLRQSKEDGEELKPRASDAKKIIVSVEELPQGGNFGRGQGLLHKKKNQPRTFLKSTIRSIQHSVLQYSPGFPVD